MTAWTYLAAMLGCGAGAALRFSLGWLDTRRTFPWPTIAANILGSALLGAVIAAGDDALLSPAWTFILGVGVAGGLSTFSSLAVDAVVLARAGRPSAVATYLATTAALGIGGAWAGYALVGLLG